MTIHNPAHELTRQAQAARNLLAVHKSYVEEDEDFAMDLIEGQTDLVEIVNVMAAQEGEDKAQVMALELYAEKLIARARRIDARIDKRRNLLLMALQTAGITKPIRGPFGTVGLRATPPKPTVTDEALIPDEFWKTPARVLDKRALGVALKEGRTIPGAELSNGGVSLSIRTN
jgi:hypothetical protein